MQDNPHAPNTTTPQAPNPDELGADIQTVATEERKLPVLQPPEKRLEAAEESGRKREEAAQMTADLAAYTKEKKKEITKVEVQAGEFDAIVKTWHKAEHVRVEKRIDWKRGVAYYVRTDTNQIVEGPRALYEHERQRTVDFETPKDAPKSDPPIEDEPEDDDRRSPPLRERIVEVLTVEDVFLTFTELMRELALDCDDEQVALEVDNELAAGLSSTPQVYARNGDGEWGLFEWVKPVSLADGIVDALGIAGSSGHTEPELRAVLYGNGIVQSNETAEREAIESELARLRSDGAVRGKKCKRWYIVEGK